MHLKTLVGFVIVAPLAVFACAAAPEHDELGTTSAPLAVACEAEASVDELAPAGAEVLEGATRASATSCSSSCEDAYVQCGNDAYSNLADCTDACNSNPLRFIPGWLPGICYPQCESAQDSEMESCNTARLSCRARCGTCKRH